MKFAAASGFALLLAALPASSLRAASDDAAPLKLVATIPMPGFAGDFDHFGVDLKRAHLFLAAEEAQTVEVFDLKTNQRIHRIPGIGHPLTMHYIEDADRLLVTDGGFPEGAPGAVRVIDGASLHVIATVPLPPGVDHSAYNPREHCFYVESSTPGAGKSSHQINVIDVGTLSVVGTVPVPGEDNEGMVVDREGEKLYINLTGPNTIGVVDLATRQLVHQWTLPADATVGHAIGLDEDNNRLFVATRKAPRLIVLDRNSGAVVAELPCTGVNSDLTYDAARKRIYVTGTDVVSVFTQAGPDQYEHLADVPSAYRAKSSLFLPDSSRLYVAASGKGKPGAQLKVLVYAAP